ncbi:MAG: YggT family protein [Sphingomonas sp.]|uniref:YggT family protein n=1 Tax=Sphingomonas sp. TaxID=28214 RepID=UPI001B1C8062|nr:YggT family protein [Sphingomonas sp.]MBO9621872.1 YggT family protein [Sphingomonas sp.]
MILILDILQVLLNVIWWIIIVQAIMSWLIAFNVINTYNEFVGSVWRALKVITDPLYRPIRRILPDFGGLDLSPMVVLVILLVIQQAVMPALYRTAMGLPV